MSTGKISFTTGAARTINVGLGAIAQVALLYWFGRTVANFNANAEIPKWYLLQ